jgi:hypothetical protein
MRAAFLATVLAISACGGEGQQDAAAPEPAATATSVASLPEPAAQAASSPTIPARFIGVWDAETGSCDPASDLRLDITPQAIGFYESQGTLTGLAEAIDGSTAVELAMEGEGDTWDMTMTISLSGIGVAERLIVQHRGEPGQPAPAPLTLKRCPA